MTTIRNIMTSHPVTCHENEDLAAATQRMWEHDIGALPVVDDHGRAIAMLTDRDVAMAAYTQGKPLRNIGVKTAMSREIHAVRADAGLDDVETVMQAHRVRRVPVIDNDRRAIGVVSLNDLARQANGRGAPVSSADLAKTLRAVCEPRETDELAAQ
jgi:CBS domain-containing protein